MTTTPDFFEARYGRFGPERVQYERDAFHADQAVRAEADKCAGGECGSILELCSKHSAQYQRQYGRASNE